MINFQLYLSIDDYSSSPLKQKCISEMKLNRRTLSAYTHIGLAVELLIFRSMLLTFVKRLTSHQRS